MINGRRFRWERGDLFVTLSWSLVEHEALEPSDLFAVTDRPVLEALHLCREETLAQSQPVNDEFVPR